MFLIDLWNSCNRPKNKQWKFQGTNAWQEEDNLPVFKAFLTFINLFTVTISSSSELE